MEKNDELQDLLETSIFLADNKWLVCGINEVDEWDGRILNRVANQTLSEPVTIFYRRELSWKEESLISRLEVNLWRKLH